MFQVLFFANSEVRQKAYPSDEATWLYSSWVSRTMLRPIIWKDPIALACTIKQVPKTGNKLVSLKIVNNGKHIYIDALR